MFNLREIVRMLSWTIPIDNLAASVRELANQYRNAIFVIDSPRMPLPSPREWYWRNNHGWRQRTSDDKGNGRHCEVVIKAHQIANPQWTPLIKNAPKWMINGFSLFTALEGIANTLEVFPSASYRILNDGDSPSVTFPFSGFLTGPKDMLDAVVAALTGNEFQAGRGYEVGGGDGLGTIVLPMPIKSPIIAVLQWPLEA